MHKSPVVEVENTGGIYKKNNGIIELKFDTQAPFHMYITSQKYPSIALVENEKC